jgi:hypothetical protein
LRESLPAGVAKAVTRVAGLGMTYDGHLVVAAPGVLAVLDRDLDLVSHLAFPGEKIRNSIAIDEEGGIYVVTGTRMVKVVWTGQELSLDEEDGAWSCGYDVVEPEQAKAAGIPAGGSGTTPTLMGFGDDPDKLVVITDAAGDGAKLVAFWRDGIPAGFRQKPGARSRRIADQIRLDITRLTVENSPQVLGYGVLLENGRYPEPAPGDVFGNAMTAGVTRPGPRGMQKLVWNPDQDRFEKAWVLEDIDNGDLVIPVVSAASNRVYAASKEDGDYVYLGIDWTTGVIRERWELPDDSRLWNPWGGFATLLEDGDILAGGFFAIKRLDVGGGERGD